MLNTVNYLFYNPSDQHCPVELPAGMEMFYVCAANGNHWSCGY